MDSLEGMCAYILMFWEGWIEACLKFYWSIGLLVYLDLLVNFVFRRLKQKLHMLFQFSETWNQKY
jgi:hypothetical protein